MKTAHFSRLAALLIVEAVCVLTAQHLFNRIEAGQTRTIAALLGSVLRDEFSMSKSYLISQYLEDMHHFGGLHCAKLSRIDNARRAVFYDSTYRAECIQNRMETIDLVGLDGHEWTLMVSAKPDPSVRLIKFVTMISLVFAVLLAFRLYESAADRERRKRHATEEKRRLLEELTDQVSHDVASPLSALQIISRKAAMDDDTRAFLLDAVSRATDIFDSLKQSREVASSIDLNIDINRIFREKTTKDPAFPVTHVDVGIRNLRLPASGFGRMASNILDNAKESGASKNLHQSRIIGIRATFDLRG